MDKEVTINEKERRNKIKSSLKAYYLTSRGIIHRQKLSESQKKRMANYGRFLQENNNTKQKEI